LLGLAGRVGVVLVAGHADLIGLDVEGRVPQVHPAQQPGAGIVAVADRPQRLGQIQAGDGERLLC
jgi:hypothetical protein